MNQFRISVVAHLIAEPVRSVMLIALSGGESLSSSALADAAGITAQTASFHLGKLREGGLVTVEAVGRHRYYQLAGPHVSHLLESLASVGPVGSQWLTTPNRSAKDLRFARCCYDHLAGQIGVAMTQGMLNRGLLAQADGSYILTDVGYEWLEQRGIEISPATADQADILRECLDWTERQYHLAGSLGARLLTAFLAWKWLVRLPDTRSLKVTATGWAAFEEHFGIRYQQGTFLFMPLP
ncbi:transcriptional regulator [Rouxiella silvae]|uniref:Transcriptional regulator n=1 Tax=Rouxiella silvae TaxID=1646373 RepID=A0AA40X4I0_9GAMM|nr:helix-turn-helix domain-containing protein [Rouxiella silvae]MBF6638334.1 helix-turn-helix transcriptional regulator [Rouxiella silvae]ORJ21924.1 transcriptional regulator [Rouxiella silvae]